MYQTTSCSIKKLENQALHDCFFNVDDDLLSNIMNRLITSYQTYEYSIAKILDTFTLSKITTLLSVQKCRP